MRVILFLFLLCGLLVANESSVKIDRLVKKGEKVANTFCVDANLSTLTGEVDAILELLSSSKPCGDLNSRNKKALAYYLAHQERNETLSHIEVPSDAKCPVCGMFVNKYPKWSALMVVDGKKYYFDGVKDMMKYYIFDADFPYSRDKIEKLEVSDFYTLNAISAKEAYYVIGSDVFGPMGDELVPFETKEGAENFMKDHTGEKIVRFDEITDKMVMGLDGL